ncbi:MAG: Dabb family protein [Planctomycetales bacterium]|nr:Dabb family protein [Planctomycetales bacterium]
MRTFAAFCAALFVFTGIQAGMHAMAKDKEAPLLRHVVLFKFKDSVTAEEIKEVEQAFAALPGKIDVIVDFEWGTDVSVEGKAKGFTHCFFVSFKDKEGRATYLPHPAHQKFVELVGPRVEDVCVVDYFVK